MRTFSCSHQKWRHFAQKTGSKDEKTDQLLVSTTPYYAHFLALLLRARGVRQDLDRTTQEPGHYDDYHDTKTGIHATDQLLVSTTPYYAHLLALRLRARGVRQDLDRTSQEPGHYDNYHDQGALSYALCLLTTPGTWGTGTARGRGICPGSSRPRARVP
jgi:hypothetical protein